MLLARQFATYSAAGVFATSVHYIVLICFVELLRRPAWQGAVSGALVGAVVGYGLNHRLTFRSTRPHRVALPRFAATALTGIVLQGLVVWVATSIFMWHYLVAQLAATAVALFATFLMNRQWTF